MEKLLNDLVGRMKTSFGDRLVSVILYGSAAAGDHHERFSDLNVFFVLAQVTPAELKGCEPLFRWWREKGNPAPLLMSREEVAASTDCFPIEFHDMKEHRRVMYGDDVVSALEIDDAFYRAQVEHELRAKLIRLRQKAAGALFDHQLLLRLMADSLSTFLVLGRHALRLAGVPAPWLKREIIPHLGSRFGVPLEPLWVLLELREGERKAKAIDPVPLLHSYLEAVRKLVDAVDQLERS